MSSTFRDGVLRIDAPKSEAAKVDRQLVHLYGSPPTESFNCHYFAHTYVDSRSRGALTLQLRSREADDIMTNRIVQDAVRGALCKALSRLLPTDDDLPELTFDEGPRPSSRTGIFSPGLSEDKVGIINLCFNSGEALQCVREHLKEISVSAGQGNRRRIYYLASTSSLPGGFFIIDCLNVDLDDIEPEALFAAIKDMTKKVGRLLGLSKIVVSAYGAEHSTTVRAYVELSEAWIAPPLSKLVNKLPCRLLWHGVPHPLLYVGYDKEFRNKKDSANYPLRGGAAESWQADGGRGGSEAAASTSQGSAEDGEAPPTAARKRKKRRDE